MKNYTSDDASDDVTVSSCVHIADDSIEDSHMSNGRNEWATQY